MTARRDEDLAARIAAAKARHDKATGKDEPARGAADQAPGNALGMAFTISAQLVVSIALGTWLGWQMDVWFGTKPLFMIVMMMLFGAAGFLNVFRGADRAHRQSRQIDSEDGP